MDEIKVAKQLTLTWENILDYPGGPRVMIGVLISVRGRQKRREMTA